MTIKFLKQRGAGFGALLVFTAASPTWGQATIAQSEPNDSIPTANLTGFTAGSSGVNVAFGNTGDGLYGPPPGNSTGDMDFFKLSAAAGQVIFVNINNAGIDPDFDSYAGVYDAAGNVLAENDDEEGTSRGYDRTSRLTYTTTAAGDYYLCVSNYIGNSSLPADPFTPGSGPGLPAGKSGPYQIFIGLDVAVPVPQFVGGSTGYPVPAFLPNKVPGIPRYDGVLTLRNTSTGSAPAASYVISSFSVTGANAARFTVSGLTPPVTILPGAELNVPVSFNSGGAGGLSSAVLNLVSNDPFNQSITLDTFGSPVVSGGTFAAKQVSATTATVNNFIVADQLLDGTEPGTTFNSTVQAINFGAGGDGKYASDLNFPKGADPGDNFVLQVTGTFSIRTAGTYTFYGFSDDGQRLRIDGTEVYAFTDANTDHLGSIALTAGPHLVELTTFDGAGGNSAELLISKQPGEFTRYIDSTWELLEAFSEDADNDGMPNAYETANGTNPDVNDANIDIEPDGLTNIQEFLKGTKPTVADTDTDGLLDGVETKSGTFSGTGNTGTDPLVRDTDGDGLPDNVENPTLATTGPAQPGSDPNKKDTDSDGFADLSEVTLGTDPKVLSSAPAFNFQPVLAETFDAPGFHSTYSFNSIAAETTIPGVYDSDSIARGKVAQLTNYQNSTHTSLTWDYVDTIAAPAVRISFDFRIGANGTNPADGFGIGLFRKSAYGTAGPSPAILNAKSWENPTGGGGYANALFFGFAVFGTDTVRLIGPTAPAVPVATLNPGFNLAPFVTPLNPYNRAIITVITNGPSSSMVKLEIIADIDGAATSNVIFDNVLVPGFTIASEDFRLIAGARTGGLASQTEIDNVTFSVPLQTTPSLLLSNTPQTFLADIYDGTTAPVNPATVQVILNGTSIPVTTSKTGNLTTVTYPGTATSFFLSGTNTVVFTYSSTTGTPFTETRTFVGGNYYLMPPALALPASTAGASGLNVRTVQATPIVSTQTFSQRLDYAEGILAGFNGTPFIGGNGANPTGAVNGIYHADVINFEQDGGTFGFFGGETLVPGIPGTNGTTDNYVFEATSWILFPETGFYQFGVVADDGFRVSATHAPVPAVSIVTPAASARILAVVPSIASTPVGGISGPYPASPVTASLIPAVPAIANTPLTNAAAIAGNIALIDRGAVSFASKIQAAQAAGAIAVILINHTFPDDIPFVMGGDGPAITGVTIPAVMISKGDGDALKALIGTSGGVTLKFGPDESTTLGKADANQTTTFQTAVGVAGLYPIRFLNFEGGGGASAEWYSIDALGGKHLVNDPLDPASLKTFSSISTGPAPTISISRSGGAIVIQYTGVLQSSPTLGSFADVNGATSPYTVPAGSPGKLFFRARP